MASFSQQAPLYPQASSQAWAGAALRLFAMLGLESKTHMTARTTATAVEDGCLPLSVGPAQLAMLGASPGMNLAS
jgi:hypothetical protein